MKLRVGTRRSPLALTQTKMALDELVRREPSLSYELVEIVTTGDRITDRPLREAGGKGLFLKELDEALLEGRVDCAVHSLKDVPTTLAAGTTLAAVLERADPRDLLVTRSGSSLAALPQGASLGTTSLRRQSQALAAVPTLDVRLLRGNVETRLRRVADGEVDATFLAAAGLARLGIDLVGAARSGVRAVVLDPFAFVPAPGQGTLAITAREDDAATIAALRALDHEASRIAATAERGFARVFGGGCHLPIAVFASLDGRALRIAGVLASPDGRTQIRDETHATLPADAAIAEAERAGSALAQGFFPRGAAEIIRLAEAGAA